MLKKGLAGFILLLMLAGTAFGQVKPGENAPDFVLFGVDYRYHQLSGYLAREDVKGAVVIFSCNHCPMVVRYEDKMVELANKYMPKGIPFIAVNANPADMVAADGFPQMIQRAKEKEFPFPYVYDETQRTSRAYGATRTPEVFIVGKDGRVVYTGAIDNRGEEPFYLADALDALLEGREIKHPVSRPFGCTVKYRK